MTALYGESHARRGCMGVAEGCWAIDKKGKWAAKQAWAKIVEAIARPWSCKNGLAKVYWALCLSPVKDKKRKINKNKTQIKYNMEI